MDPVGDSIEVIDPATEQVITRLPSAVPEDADRAVARAKSSFKTWRNVAAGDRNGGGRLRLLRRCLSISVVTRRTAPEGPDLNDYGYDYGTPVRRYEEA